MSVYGVAQIRIHDRERYAQYGAGLMDIFLRLGGELLDVDEEPQVLGGEWPHSRSVLLPFDTKAQLDVWYSARPIRLWQNIAGQRRWPTLRS